MKNASPNKQPKEIEAAKPAQDETIYFQDGRPVPIFEGTMTIAEGSDKGKQFKRKFVLNDYPYTPSYYPQAAPVFPRPNEPQVMFPQRNYDSTDVYRIVQREKLSNGGTIPPGYLIFTPDHPITKQYLV